MENITERLSQATLDTGKDDETPASDQKNVVDADLISKRLLAQDKFVVDQEAKTSRLLALPGEIRNKFASHTLRRK